MKSLRWTLGLFLAVSLQLDAATWKAGTAKADITPSKPIWMAGYGGRTAPSDGALHPLWAKALALEDAKGKRAVIVSTDTLGMTLSIYGNLKAALAKKYDLQPDQIQLNASHTHTGPVLRGGLYDIYPLNEKLLKVIDEYSSRLEKSIVTIVGQALADLKPATVRHGIGVSRFGVNRRENRPAGDVPKHIMANTLKGPIDHDVPVLAVYQDTKLKAVVFGYACHSTTLGIQQFSGDYSGWAQIDLEKSHPGALALFSAGCGGDVNPLPRREVRYAERYGHMLAAAVEETLLQKMTILKPAIRTTITSVDLEYGSLPDEKSLQAAAKKPTNYRGRWAARMLKLQAKGNLEKTYPYPLQCWRLGDLLWITMGGEVVVDFSLKFKKQFGAKTWVTAYCNDVMAYIPSLRVLKEGGYEGQSSMAVYGLPADRWKENVEDLVTDAAAKLVRQSK
jgi:neutral ceramidase